MKNKNLNKKEKDLLKHLLIEPDRALRNLNYYYSCGYKDEFENEMEMTIEEAKEIMKSIIDKLEN